MAKIFDLYYGEPGSAKTASILALIKYVKETSGKNARVYTGDGSKLMYSLAMEDPTWNLPKGTIKQMDFVIRDWPFTTCQQITEGFWPEDPEDPQSKMKKLTPQEVQETGIWIFEGASVMGNYMLGDARGGLAQRAADGEVLGQEANIKFTDLNSEGKASDYKFGGNAGAHYNIGQRHILADILRSKSLPGVVIWTAHERMDDGERGGAFAKGGAEVKYKMADKVIGPEIVGKAMTQNISREFGNTLHFCTATKKIQGEADKVTGKTSYKDKTEYRVYTRDHYDPDGIVPSKYRAVNRTLTPEKVKDFYISEKLGEGLLEFYQDIRG